MAVERKVTGGPVRNYELPPHAIDASPDFGMTLENRDSVSNARNDSRTGRGFQKKLNDPLEVGECFRRIDYSRQRTGLGRRAARPRVRPVTYACTSFAA